MAATFGQRLFFEKSYSGAIIVGDDGTNGGNGAVGETGKVGCVSCHDPTNWYIDTRSQPGNVSLGVNYTVHNAPSLVNAAYYKWLTWPGKMDSPWCQGANAPETPTDAGSSRLAYAHMVYAKYKSDYNALFPVPLDPALDPAAADASRFPATGNAEVEPDGARRRVGDDGGRRSADRRDHHGQLRQGARGLRAAARQPQRAHRSLRRRRLYRPQRQRQAGPAACSSARPPA